MRRLQSVEMAIKAKLYAKFSGMVGDHNSAMRDFNIENGLTLELIGMRITRELEQPISECIRDYIRISMLRGMSK